MDTKSALKSYLNPIKSEVFGALIEETMQEMAPPPNSLESKEAWRGKTENALMEAISGQATIDKTADGFDAIMEDLRTHLSTSAVENISKEWELGIERWVEKAKLEEGMNPPDTLLEALGISEETLNHFYHAGMRYFANKDFKKASDVFYAIAGLDPRRYNVWLHLGLSEAHLERYEPALISFSMASIMNIDAPYPYIYSAECCLKDSRKDEARSYLDLAQEAVEKEQPGNKQTLLNSINHLKQLCH